VPSARLLVLIAAGLQCGAVTGAITSLVVTVPELLLDPSYQGGTGSVGLTLVGLILGAILGAVVGVIVGCVGCAAVALAGAVRAPLAVVAAIGAVASGAAAVAITLGFASQTATGHPGAAPVPLDASTVTIAAAGALLAAGGTVLFVMLDARMQR
jgi:hypothetical protein